MNDMTAIKTNRLKGVLLRVPLDVHTALRRAAYEQNTSINKLANTELAKLMNALFQTKTPSIAPELGGTGAIDEADSKPVEGLNNAKSSTSAG